MPGSASTAATADAQRAHEQHIYHYQLASTRRAALQISVARTAADRRLGLLWPKLQQLLVHFRDGRLGQEIHLAEVIREAHERG